MSAVSTCRVVQHNQVLSYPAMPRRDNVGDSAATHCEKVLKKFSGGKFKRPAINQFH